MAINNFLGNEKTTATRPSGKEYLTFSIGIDVYAIEIFYVFDIIQKSITPVTPLPMVPDYIMGVINLRGKITPVIDVRMRIGIPFREYDDFNCIIVIEYDDMRIGLIVDTVEETCSIPDAAVSEAPVTHDGFRNRYVSGIATTDGAVRLVLDVPALLMSDELHIAAEG